MTKLTSCSCICSTDASLCITSANSILDCRISRLKISLSKVSCRFSCISLSSMTDRPMPIPTPPACESISIPWTWKGICTCEFLPGFRTPWRVILLRFSEPPRKNLGLAKVQEFCSTLRKP